MSSPCQRQGPQTHSGDGTLRLYAAKEFTFSLYILFTLFWSFREGTFQKEDKIFPFKIKNGNKIYQNVKLSTK